MAPVPAPGRWEPPLSWPSASLVLTGLSWEGSGFGPKTVIAFCLSFRSLHHTTMCGWGCHVVGTPVPAWAALVIGMSKFWCSLKGFCCSCCLFVWVQGGRTQRKFSSQSCPMSCPTVIHLGVCIDICSLWNPVKSSTMSSWSLYSRGLYSSSHPFPVHRWFSSSCLLLCLLEPSGGACQPGLAAAGLAHPLLFFSSSPVS